jgi:hypothetical protein
MNFIKKNIIFAFFLLTFLLLFQNVLAANLYLDSADNNVVLNNAFAIEVRLNLDQETSINAVDAYLNYPADLLQVVDISFGNSILNIIPQQPIIDAQAGTIHFGGGITSGYTGKIPGDPGLSNLLTTVIFKEIKKPTNSPSFQIALDTKSAVFLNDGKGTLASLTLTNLTLNTAESSNNLSNEWQQILAQDTIAPESFSIILSRDPSIYNNQYFITFNTTDKQSGIDYYQIKEGAIAWTKVDSPYLLKNQSLPSIILVKAVDKAGNERIAEYIPAKIKTTNVVLSIILILMILFLMAIANYFIIKSFKAAKILK